MFIIGCSQESLEESDCYDVVIYGANSAGVIAAYTAKTMGKSVILIEPGNHLGEMTTTGLRMNRFYSASPTCCPTRGSIITGRHPNRYGTFTPGFSIRPEEISIAQIMKDAGYATAHFDKRHLGPVKAKSPTNPKAMGFDEYLSHDNFFELNPHLSRNGSGEQPFRNTHCRGHSFYSKIYGHFKPLNFGRFFYASKVG